MLKITVKALLNIIEQNIINQNYVIGSRNEKTNNQLIIEIVLTALEGYDPESNTIIKN